MRLYEAGVLRFEEAYMPRVWGGRGLEKRFGKALPSGEPIGEAWLLSDHPVHVSIIAEGSLQGRSLRDLMQKDADWLLGKAKPTRHGRFPLLLKLLDAKENLSVQVHPDDECAKALGEQDGGKTEMWHVLGAAPGANLFCGLEGVRDTAHFQEMLAAGDVVRYLHAVPARTGQSVFIPAGMVHAIGAGVLLAEIQQNSDLTYRIFDWNREGRGDSPRELHLEKALKATKVSVMPHIVQLSEISGRCGGGSASVLTSCPYFTVQQLLLGDENTTFDTGGESPHLLLPLESPLQVETGHNCLKLQPAQAALVPALTGGYTLHGSGPVLRFWAGVTEGR